MVPRVPSSGSGPGSWSICAQVLPRETSVSTWAPACPPPLGPGFSRVMEMTVSWASVPLVGVSLAAVKLHSLQTPRGQSAGRQGSSGQDRTLT